MGIPALSKKKGGRREHFSLDSFVDLSHSTTTTTSLSELFDIGYRILKLGTRELTRTNPSVGYYESHLS